MPFLSIARLRVRSWRYLPAFLLIVAERTDEDLNGLCGRRGAVRPSAGADFWDVIAIVQTKDGNSLRLEVDKARNLQECKNRAAAAYAHLPNGPIFCQHITQVELIDVYGNARPVE